MADSTHFMSSTGPAGGKNCPLRGCGAVYEKQMQGFDPPRDGLELVGIFRSQATWKELGNLLASH
eukprot:CAMPEP_0178438302 /NCGR_PEP_ID=MMETSP0689_2-20121128/35517_1 /TAXON_ID=160604 /ORGANISM="Amphidinium massartii, Strain CS-259" /LENGTH=64 /DNA_ID=CAMNT_0020060689 /DNA_START=11 /DNA_END=202 /DNA_ORIENTATION=+